MSEDKHQHSSGKNIGLAFLLNLGFASFELVGGLLTNSIAILSDALHDFGDSLSLGFAWLLNRYSKRPADVRFTYGYRRFSLLGALLSSVVLVVGSLLVFSEAVQRLQNPEPFNTSGVLFIAVIGIAVNGFAAMRLRQDNTLNERVISWHLLEDVLGWIVVMVMGIISLFVDLPILDPLLSIGITLFVLFNVARNIWATLRVFLQATPKDVDMGVVETKLRAINGIQAVHHLRIWSLDGESNVLTAHLVVKPDTQMADLSRIKEESRNALSDLNLEDTTFQFDATNADSGDGEGQAEREGQHTHTH